jgi:hypothetical protein
MKKTLLTLILAISFCGAYGQKTKTRAIPEPVLEPDEEPVAEIEFPEDYYEVRKWYNYQKLSEQDKLAFLMSEYVPLVRESGTDSIYVFLRSTPWVSESGTISILDDQPIVLNPTLLPKVESLFSKYLPQTVIRNLMDKAVDPATVGLIERWNSAEIGDDWVTAGNYAQMYGGIVSLTERVMDEGYGSRRAHRKYLRILRDFNNSAVRYALSVPVFDEEYRYAFMVMRKSGAADSFALFERKDSGWQSIHSVDIAEK